MEDSVDDRFYIGVVGSGPSSAVWSCLGEGGEDSVDDWLYRGGWSVGTSVEGMGGMRLMGVLVGPPIQNSRRQRQP